MPYQNKPEQFGKQIPNIGWKPFPACPGSQNGVGQEARSAGGHSPGGSAGDRAKPARPQRTVGAEAVGVEGRKAEAVAATGDMPGGGAAAESGPLDSTQSKCVAPPVNCEDGNEAMEASPRSRRRLRWSARAALWSASTLKSVRCCGRILGRGLHDQADWVNVKKAGNLAGYGNLAVCGSPWACPRCSAVIAMERSQEIGRAVQECHAQGGDVAMMTLTLRHNAGDSIEDLWEGLSAGWRSTFGCHGWTGVKPRKRKGKNGKTRVVPGKVGDRDRFQIAGTVRSVECTFGRPELGGAGWHLHAHVLIYASTKFSDMLDRDGVSRLLDLDRPATDAEVRMIALALIGYRCFGRWQEGVQVAGLPAPTGDGFDLRAVEDQGAEFIGSYLAKSTLDVAAKVGAEVGGGRNTKSGHFDRNVTPFELLDDVTRRGDAPRLGFRTPRHWDWLDLPEGGSGVVDLDSGEVTEVKAPGEWSRWHAWERASKSRRQILWSLTVKNPISHREHVWNDILDARGRDKDDKEIAEVEVRGETVAQISRAGWYRRMVWRPTWLTDLLEVVEDAEDNDTAALVAERWMKDHDVGSSAVELATAVENK